MPPDPHVPPGGVITGFSNPLIKRIRALRDKKHRRAEGLFLAEGLRVMGDGLAAGLTPLWLFHAEGARLGPLAERLVAATTAAGGSIVATSPAILAKLSGKDNPQAMVGVYRDFARPLELLDRTSAPIWLVAERLRDPGNLGTMLRTGDAVGAGGLILLDECTDPFGVEAVRASMGAVFTQAIVRAESTAFLAWLRQGPGQLVATTLAPDAVDYQSVTYADPTFILVGNEAQGLPEALAAAADVRVTMPMRGRADSLNAAIAAAVMAYEVLNQQRRRRAP